MRLDREGIELDHRILLREPHQSLGSIGAFYQISLPPSEDANPDRSSQLTARLEPRVDEVIALFKSFIKKTSFIKSVPFNCLQSLLHACFNYSTAHSQALVTLLLTEVNSVLKLYRFKYIITHDGDDFKPCTFRFVNPLLPLSHPAYSYFYKELSSGEKSILDILILSYCAQLEAFNKTVLALDEPDKYLDPKSCKILFQIIDKEFLDRNIQIIMSSHRLDTIALMHETDRSRIFRVIRDDQGILTISPTTKLISMFRLTHNLRAIVNLHTKIYVESHMDARFYSCIYSILVKRCTDIKEAYRASDILDRRMHFLSKRYQLAFHSVALDASGGAGGCHKVIDMLTRDLASRDLSLEIYGRDGIEAAFDQWLEKEELYITKPFGILDRDYREHSPVGHRFVSLRRHSLENFLFDPFIVISLLDDVQKISDGDIRSICEDLRAYIILYDFSDKDFLHFITNSDVQICVREHGRAYYLQTLVDRYFLALLSLAHSKFHHSGWTPKDIQEKSWRFNGAKDDLTKGEIIASALANTIKTKAETVGLHDGYNRREHLAQLIREKWEVEETEIHDSDNKRFNMICDDILKPERIVQYRRINDVKARSSSLHSFGHKTIRVMADKNRSSILEVKYPLLFLELRGHDIEYAFPISIRSQRTEGKERREFKNYLLDNLLVHKETMVPLDLAEIFFRLDIRLRNQAYKRAEMLETDAEIADDIIISALSKANTVPSGASHMGAAAHGSAASSIVSGTFCTKPSASSWSRYHIDGLDHLLPLRLAGIHIAVCNAKIIHEHILLSPISITACSATIVIPLIYVSTSKPAHAVGIILDKISGADSTVLLYKATYLDPENNPIPTAVIQIITSSLPFNAHIKFEQRFVEEQLYSNNCGPKLIEDLYEAVSGKKGVPQHLIPYAHSELLERILYAEASYMTVRVPLIMFRDLNLNNTLMLRVSLDVSDLTQTSFLDKINILVNGWFETQLKHIVCHKDLTEEEEGKRTRKVELADEPENVLSLNKVKREPLMDNSQISINGNSTRFLWENSLTSNMALTFSAVVLLVILFKIAKLCREAVRKPIRFNWESHNTKNQSLKVSVMSSGQDSDKKRLGLDQQ